MSALDIRTSWERKHGWWIEERATVPCALPEDGLIVVFRREDVEAIIDAWYPHTRAGDDKIWYFNETRDREIAEIDTEGRISANPHVLLAHFMRARP